MRFSVPSALLAGLHAATAAVVTRAPQVPVGLGLAARAPQSGACGTTSGVADCCQSQGPWFCEAGSGKSSHGTCFTAGGYVGCCSVTSCKPRSTCYPYSGSVQSCDTDNGGCIACDTFSPYCVTETNLVASQSVVYCGVTPTQKTHSYTPDGWPWSTSSLGPTSTKNSSTSTASASKGTGSSTSGGPANTTAPIGGGTPSKGVIAGSVIGALAGAALVTALFLIFRKRPEASDVEPPLWRPTGPTMEPIYQQSNPVINRNPDGASDDYNYQGPAGVYAPPHA